MFPGLQLCRQDGDTSQTTSYNEYTFTQLRVFVPHALFRQPTQVIRDEKGDHGVRGDSDIVGREPSIEPEDALFSCHLCKHARHADLLPTGGLSMLLHTGLDKVER